MSDAGPRLVIAGTAGDSGKTLVSLGLLRCWRARGLEPAAFKKGPDYIDAAWLALASGRPCRNLDTFLQPADRLLDSFRRHASRGVSLVEGNRGLLDGADLEGTHSTAALAELLGAPVVLVVSAAKVTRTVAAPVLGCRQLAPGTDLVGVILNGVSGGRHERVTRQAVESLTGLPVLGVIPRRREGFLPDRHLGLVPPQEHPRREEILAAIEETIAKHVDLERLLALAAGAGALGARRGEGPEEAETIAGAPAVAFGVEEKRARIGVFQDSAFTFYYPENLEALERAGGELVPVSGLADGRLPAVDALYLGGGFPETHAERLAANTSLQGEVRRAAEAGMPIYAECGGLIYLSRALHRGEERFPLAGVLPLELELLPRPQGHGYVELEVDGESAFFERGTRLRGHEFHYSRIRGGGALPSVFAVRRGTGCGGGRDGVIYKNVLAGYTHLHALGTPEWAPALLRAARTFGRRNSNYK